MRFSRWFPVLILATFISGAAAAEEKGGLYLSPGQVDLATLLPPPPAPKGPEDKKDLAAVLAAQSARTPDQSARAKADAAKDVFRFADAVGPQFTADRFPKAAAFFHQLVLESEVPVLAAKLHWARLRPDLADPKVVPLMRSKKPNDGSYPSGHATFGTLTAILLAEMLPEKSPQIFARGLDYAHNRVILGVHYPSDTEAGRLSGTVLAYAMQQNPVFKRDFEAAKAEVRAGLGMK